MDTFGSIPLSTCFVSKSEVMTAERCLKPRHTIDEEQCVVHVVLLFEFAQNHLRDRGRSVWIDASEEDVGIA